MNITNDAGLAGEKFADALKDVECDLFVGRALIRADSDTDRCYLQLIARDVTFATGIMVKGRKWLLSQHMTADEIRQTLFVALITYHEHELRESFTYKGVAIFGPHLKHDRLIEVLADEDSLSVRAEA